MNEFQFKIPEKLKEAVRKNKANISISYTTYEGEVFIDVVINNKELQQVNNWNEYFSKESFNTWFEKLNWF